MRLRELRAGRVERGEGGHGHRPAHPGRRSRRGLWQHVPRQQDGGRRRVQPEDRVRGRPKDLLGSGYDIIWDGTGADNRFDQPGANAFPPILPASRWPAPLYNVYWRLWNFDA